MTQTFTEKKVAVIGGGLAGLSAATVLAERGVSVELFEAKQHLGGRAGSFHDSTTDELVDHCQHVGMGCCTNLSDFCRRTGIEGLFRRHRLLHFFGPDGRRYDFRGTCCLPAPLHLATSFMKLGYLSWRERRGVARAMLRLARTTPEDTDESQTVGQWLRDQGQSDHAIDRFWSVVLVSALGESVDRASLAASRKVFVDGFLSHRDAYCIDIPTVSLGELYDHHVAQCLRKLGAVIHLGRPVAKITCGGNGSAAVTLDGEASRPFDAVVAAVPWRRVGELLGDSLPELETLRQIESAPITGVHLWLDRAITPLPHAVLIDRLSQWVFSRGERKMPGGAQEQSPRTAFYYQVVISASRQLAGRNREEVLEEILDDLNTIWPEAKEAELLHWRMVTQQEAVFSVGPGIEKIRPSQQTARDNIFLAGDWTRTGWPATMEGAVRSGYLAAEAVLKSWGREEKVVVDDLPRGWLARWLLGG